MRAYVMGLMVMCPVWAMAHTASAYILPESFDSKAETATMISAITVEKFFVPSRNFNTSYQVRMPSGQTKTLEPAASFKRMSVAEVALPEEGTYHIRTQNAEANKSKYALIDGQWRRIRPNRPANMAAQPAKAEPSKEMAQNQNASKDTKEAPKQPPRAIAEDQIPAGARIIETSNLPIAESFITKGKPTPLAALSNKGLEIKWITHPSEVYVGEGVQVQVLMDGKPVSGLEVDVFKGASGYERDAKREQPAVKTDDQGMAKIDIANGGIYLITTQYPVASEDLSVQPPAQSYTYSATFEAVQ